MSGERRRLKFIDLFCGIGGIRLAFENSKGLCVFSSDWDSFARNTYAANFGEIPRSDIREISSEEIPNHDILTAGFPCQPFSISGISKKNSLGRPHGFMDQTQGTLFFEVARIIKNKQPRAFLLENVKNLVRHDGGKTFQVILHTLEEDLGYEVYHRVIDARHWVPQHRERIFIVGFRDPVENFKFPEPPKRTSPPRVQDILEKDVSKKYTLSSHLWNYLKDYARKHREAGNGFGYGLTSLDGVARTLSARYYKDGSEILIPQGVNGRALPRRLTPRECARLMGFPDTFHWPVSDTQAYKQFGNSVVVPVVRAIATEVVRALNTQAKVSSPEKKRVRNGQFRLPLSVPS